MATNSRKVDLGWVTEHFNPRDPRLVGDGPLYADGLWNAIDLMLEQCPIVESDGEWFGSPHGSWVVSRYEDVMAIIQEPTLFSNQVQKGHWEDEPLQIPIDFDPPLHTEYRRLLQPHLTIRAVAKFEPISRQILTRLLDEIIESGSCDNFAAQVTRPFSAQVQLGKLVGVDEGDHEQLLTWVLTFLHHRFEPEFETSTRAFMSWITETIARRRSEPRRDDLVDGLMHGQVQGRLLADDEICRAVMLMIIAGLLATADAISSIVLRLAVYPELQERLRSNLALLPQAIEEFLRLEPSVTGAPRRCTRDTVFLGQQIKAGEQVLIHTAAANRDPREFERPHDFDLDRGRSRHVAFGAGHHRCLGSNFARLNLRIALEEILSRMHDLRLPEGEAPSRTPDLGWMIDRLPLTFSPGPRLG